MSVEHIPWLPKLPARPVEGHKGVFGHVLIIAGSRGMSGAAALAGLGALRGGAGLVTVAVPHGIQSIVASIEPSYLTLGLPEDDRGRIAAAARGELEPIVAKYDVLAIGSGWGMSADITSLVRWLYQEVEAPMVLDADALNTLAESPGIFERAGGPRILTPHPGEFGRLIRQETKAVQENREPLAMQFAEEKGVILLLKGAGSIITDGRRVAVNRTGNSGMATGGSGDVLTGLIAALLGQGVSPFEAASLGAHLHGLAGDLAAADLSSAGLIASDLPNYLPRAFVQLGG